MQRIARDQGPLHAGQVVAGTLGVHPGVRIGVTGIGTVDHAQRGHAIGERDHRVGGP